MEDQEQKKLEVENLEATELEDEDLEDASGGSNICPTNYCKPSGE